MTARARIRISPVAALVLGALVALSAHQFVGRLALLFMAALLATGAVILLTRWYGFVQEA